MTVGNLAPPLLDVAYEGIHCALAITRPGAGIVRVVLSGSDIGEFGDLALRELAKDLERFRSIALFIDAGAVRGASVEVSAEWALWMNAHRSQLRQISMLTGSRYVQITALFVRRFAELVDRMRIFTDRAAFEETLLSSVRRTEPMID
jgi:hypothetical protein